ncbi:MAG: PsbP-related protein [Nitrososphaeraceae archaeon]
MNRSIVLRFVITSAVLALVLICLSPMLLQKPIKYVQASSSLSTTNQDNKDNEDDHEDNLSRYENPALGFRIKYPSDFRIAEVTDSPVSMTISFEKIRIAPSTGAYLTINATKENAGITFDELRETMSHSIKSGPGTRILENDTTLISGVTVYEIVQNHENSPFGRNAIAIFIGAIHDNTTYMLRSLSTDVETLQEMVDSFEFIN